MIKIIETYKGDIGYFVSLEEGATSFNAGNYPSVYRFMFKDIEKILQQKEKSDYDKYMQLATLVLKRTQEMKNVDVLLNCRGENDYVIEIHIGDQNAKQEK